MHEVRDMIKKIPLWNKDISGNYISLTSVYPASTKWQRQALRIQHRTDEENEITNLHPHTGYTDVVWEERKTSKQVSYTEESESGGYRSQLAFATMKKEI